MTIAIKMLYTILAASLFFGVWAAGCNTTQSPNRQVSDVQITTEVKAKLASNVGPSSLTNIEVNTTNGVVTLAGQVESAEIERGAKENASSVTGVVQVNNNLQVAKEGVKDAGSDTKDAARSTEDAVKKAGDAVADATKRAVHEGAEAVEKAADRVKEKTE